MRFHELFTPKKLVSELGALKFSSGLFDEGKTRFPHDEMSMAIEAFLNRPQINSGIRQMVTFLFGKRVYIESKDKKTKEFLNKWLEKRDVELKLRNEFGVSALVTGNAYLENTFRKLHNQDLVLDNVFPITDSSRVYRNLNATSHDEYWIYEVPVELKTFPFPDEEGNIKHLRPKFYFINYVMSSSTLFRKSVYGIPIHKNKLSHFKWGWSRDMIYGRSFLMSCIDDTEVLREIIKNWSIISRYRALNVKLISIGNENNRATIDDINLLDKQLRDRRESEHIIINKPFTVESLTNVGEYDTMENAIEFLRKDAASGLVPNYLTPWNSEVNRATSEEVRVAFQLQLNIMQKDIIDFLNRAILKPLLEKYDFLKNEETTFMIDPVDLTPQSEKLSAASQLFSQNVITLNEYREMIGLPPVPDGDKFEKDIISIQPPGPGFESFQEAVKKKEDESDIDSDDYFDKPTPEDDIAEEIFSKLTDIYLELTDKFFNELEKKKTPIKKEAYITGIDPNISKSLERVFGKFDNKLQPIIERAARKIAEATLTPEQRTKPLTRTEQKELEKKLKLLLVGFENQLKAFNAKKMQDIRRKILEGIAAGLPYSKIKERIQQDINNYKRKENPYEFEIARIVRTEVGKSTNLLKLLRWKKQGFTKYRWVTMRDERVRPAAIPNQSARQKGRSKHPFPDPANHWDRHNKIFSIDDALSGKDIFPGGSLVPGKPNINCRCTAVLHIE